MNEEGEQNLIIADQKPRRCPICKGKIATVLYGMPEYSPELIEKFESGKITLGGCCHEIGAADWVCVSCGLGFVKEPTDPEDHEILKSIMPECGLPYIEQKERERKERAERKS